MDIRTETSMASPERRDDVAKICWQGERIARLVFASGKVIDFTRSDAEAARDQWQGRAAGDR